MLAQSALAGDFATARELQRKYQDLMEVNFVESNPVPVKYGDGADGIAGAGLAAADDAAAGRVAAKDRSRAAESRVCWRECTRDSAPTQLQAQIEELFDQKPAQYTADRVQRLSMTFGNC